MERTDGTSVAIFSKAQGKGKQDLNPKMASTCGLQCIIQLQHAVFYRNKGLGPRFKSFPAA